MSFDDLAQLWATFQKNTIIIHALSWKGLFIHILSLTVARISVYRIFRKAQYL